MSCEVRPWLKITFDSLKPGTASVSQYPLQRRKVVPGQWVVFDKDKGEYDPRHVLFASSDIDECHAFIRGATHIVCAGD